MKRIIFDIETIGKEFESLDDNLKDYLLRWAETNEEEEKVKERLGLSPVTGEIVAIALLETSTMSGKVFFQSPEMLSLPFEEEGILYEAGTEKDIIERFWQNVKDAEQIVTFNGRTFDCPFILVRSAYYKLRPTVDLLPGRYNGFHIDLLDHLTFFGATRKYNLDIWCRFFGIRSPKEDMSGSQVGELFRKGKYLDIARYCIRDVFATKQLFEYWENYIKPR